MNLFAVGFLTPLLRPGRIHAIMVSAFKAEIVRPKLSFYPTQVPVTSWQFSSFFPPHAGIRGGNLDCSEN